MSNHETHDWKTLQAALVRVGEYLQKPTRLVLIGSSVGMFYGQPGRMTEDIDVWSPNSRVDIADITQACKKAGIAFDPQGYDVSDVGLYLQMVKPGIVHVGKWKSEETMFTSGNLTVAHPPVENIIASKLVRCTDADVEDTVYLIKRLGLSMDTVRRGVATLSPSAKEIADENMVLIEIHSELAGQASNFESGNRLSMASMASVLAPKAVTQPRRPHM